MEGDRTLLWCAVHFKATIGERDFGSFTGTSCDGMLECPTGHGARRRKCRATGAFDAGSFQGREESTACVRGSRARRQEGGCSAFTPPSSHGHEPEGSVDARSERPSHVPRRGWTAFDCDFNLCMGMALSGTTPLRGQRGMGMCAAL
eukprot:1221250-Rhodomonas_salina.1